MSTTTGATSGSFSPLTAGPIRTDTEFDLENLTDEEREVVTSDEFIVYGRASIEQWNDPAPGEDHLYIEIDALEERLDQLLALNNLSRRHDDVKVGEFREEYTLDEPTTIHLDDDETLRFDAGDTLKTQVIREGDPLPGGEGEAEEDALWIIANVYGRGDPEGSVLSEETRLGAYYGHLDGFSVTVYTREFTPDEGPDGGPGKRAHEVDFLAVTIGEDELIKNKGSHFGVAEFQALFGTDDAGTTPGRSGRPTAEAPIRTLITQKIMRQTFKNLFSQSKDGLAAETIKVAQQEELSLEEAAAEVASDDDADTIAQQADERLESISERLEQEEMERDDLAAEVADELGMDVEEVHALFDELEAAVEAEDEDPENDEPGEDEGPGADEQGLTEEQADEVKGIVQEAVGDAIGEHLDTEGEEPEDDSEYVTEEQLDERLDDLGQQFEENIEGVGETIADNLESQMATPTPSGGGVNAENDLKEELDGMVDTMTFGQGGD